MLMCTEILRSDFDESEKNPTEEKEHIKNV